MSFSKAQKKEITDVLIASSKKDLIFKIIGLLLLILILFILFVLILDLFLKGSSRLNGSFLSEFPSRKPLVAGILSSWVGSLCVLATTAILAIPVGVGAAVYLEEYAQKSWISRFIELNILSLAGVPSIIYGLMALGLCVYKLGLGASILTAGLTLGLLILPIIIVTTREALKTVPLSIREAAFALGASKWEVVKDHLLPYSSGGILTGVIMALSRAFGETAPLITIGALTFVAFLPESPFQNHFPFVNVDFLYDPFSVIPIQLYNWLSRPQKEFHINAAAAGFILLGMTLFMNMIAIYIRYQSRKKIKW